MSEPRRLPLARLLLLGVILPTIWVSIDYWLLNGIQNQSGGARHVALTMGVLVIQIGVMGWLYGRLLENLWWRWGLYVWGWALINLQLFASSAFAGRWTDGGQLHASMFAAQIALILIWAILGTSRWVIRWPVCAVLGTLLMLPMDLGYGLVRQILPVQIAALAVLSLLLRWRGFRLQCVEGDNAKPPAIGFNSPMEQGRPTQFNIRHVLVWMTSLAVVLGVLRTLDLLSLSALAPTFQHDLVAVLTGGLLLAAVLVVSMWAALGSGPLWLRLPVLALTLLAMGFALALLNWHAEAGLTLDDFWHYQVEFWQFNSGLFAWLALAGSLLFASLMILRASGYRLVRPQMNALQHPKRRSSSLE